jgi:hypothetical protein
MKIKRRKWVRLFGVKLMTLPWGIYAAPKAMVKEEDVVHEFIHVEQWKELLYIGFIILFIVEWLIRQLSYSAFWFYRFATGGFKKIPYNRNHGYKNISLEREAYKHDDDLKYLEKRTRFAFLKYI